MEQFTQINPKTFEGTIPSGPDLVVVDETEASNKSFDGALVLYGFDEIGQFEECFEKPVYGFLKV